MIHFTPALSANSNTPWQPRKRPPPTATLINEDFKISLQCAANSSQLASTKKDRNTWYEKDICIRLSGQNSLARWFGIRRYGEVRTWPNAVADPGKRKPSLPAKRDEKKTWLTRREISNQPHTYTYRDTRIQRMCLNRPIRATCNELTTTRRSFSPKKPI